MSENGGLLSSVALGVSTLFLLSQGVKKLVTGEEKVNQAIDSQSESSSEDEIEEEVKIESVKHQQPQQIIEAKPNIINPINEEEEDVLKLALLKFKGKLIQSMSKEELENHLGNLGLETQGSKVDLISRLGRAVLALKGEKSVLVDDMPEVRKSLVSLSSGLPQEKYERLKALLRGRVEGSPRDTSYIPSAPASRTPVDVIRDLTHTGTRSRQQPSGYHDLNTSSSSAFGSTIKRPTQDISDLLSERKRNRDEVVDSSNIKRARGTTFEALTPPPSVLKRNRSALNSSSINASVPNADEVARRILSTLGKMGTPMEEMKARRSIGVSEFFNQRKERVSSLPQPNLVASKEEEEETPPAKQMKLSRDVDEERKPPKQQPPQQQQQQMTPAPKETSLSRPKFDFSPPPSVSRLQQKKDFVPTPQDIAKYNFDKSSGWICKCGVDNENDTKVCSFCSSPKPTVNSSVTLQKPSTTTTTTSTALAPSAPVSSSTAPSQAASVPPSENPWTKWALGPDQWQCKACKSKNPKSSDACLSCEEPRGKEENKTIKEENKTVSFAEKKDVFVYPKESTSTKTRKDGTEDVEKVESILKSSNNGSSSGTGGFNFGGTSQTASDSPFSFGGQTSTPSSLFPIAPASKSEDNGKTEKEPPVFSSGPADIPKISSTTSTIPMNLTTTSSDPPFVFNKAQESTSIFGGSSSSLFTPSTAPVNSNIFSNSTTAPSMAATTATTKPFLFGTNSNASSSTAIAPPPVSAPSINFGTNNSASAAPSLFSAPAPTEASTSSSVNEIVRPPSQSSTFGGNNQTTSSNSVFGNPVSTSSSLFTPAPAQAPNAPTPFAPVASTSNTTFGGGFGGSTTVQPPAPSTQTPFGSSFGGSTTVQPTASSTQTPFGSNSNPPNSSGAEIFSFGASSATQPFTFGASSNTPAPFAFGSSSVSTAPQPTPFSFTSAAPSNPLPPQSQPSQFNFPSSNNGGGNAQLFGSAAPSSAGGGFGFPQNTATPPPFQTGSFNTNVGFGGGQPGFQFGNQQAPGGGGGFPSTNNSFNPQMGFGNNNPGFNPSYPGFGDTSGMSAGFAPGAGVNTPLGHKRKTAIRPSNKRKM